MCHVSEEAKASLQQWATLEKKLAPLLKRVKQYQDAQKMIEESVKAELTVTGRQYGAIPGSA